MNITFAHSPRPLTHPKPKKHHPQTPHSLLLISAGKPLTRFACAHSLLMKSITHISRTRHAHITAQERVKAYMLEHSIYRHMLVCTHTRCQRTLLLYSISFCRVRVGTHKSLASRHGSHSLCALWHVRGHIAHTILYMEAGEV